VHTDKEVPISRTSGAAAAPKAEGCTSEAEAQRREQTP